MAALALVVVLALLPRWFVSPRTVRQVSFVNQTPYAIDVRVSGARRDGSTNLGTAEPNRTTLMQRVIDQGDTWIVDLASQGQDGGELQFTKANLVRSGWRIVIPTTVGGRLGREGAQPGSG